ncbi:MAG: hypothetical protein SVR81_00370 [Chloroflexota bacterium]|nr:hypothetical protein [Chloroflexota bacterium]
MNTSSDLKIEKPNVIQALLSGFNTIASKPYLILLPVLLDLFLWFGPVWRVDELFGPIIDELTNLPGLGTPEYAGVLETYQTFWQDLLNNFNLAKVIHTFPVGLPSLMVGKPPMANPIGRPVVFSLNTNSQIGLVLALFLLVGYFLGNLYFEKISQEVKIKQSGSSAKTVLWSFIQILIMPILMVVILLVLSLPLLFLMTLVMMMGQALSQILVLMAVMLLLWILMPLIFTPHGIYLYKQNLISAMMTSISVVRVSMGRTAWFILISYVMTQGLNYLWQTPGVENWLLIVGIFGHAFVVTAVLAASFYYFIDATKFTQTVINQQKAPSN